MQTEEKNEIPSEKVDLPTGKPHISYSELKNWKECPYRHKLLYVDKLDVFRPSYHMSFGTATHLAIENFFKFNDFKFSEVDNYLRKEWENGNFEKDYQIEKASTTVRELCSEFLMFMDKNFPGYKWEHSEFHLYEKIEGFDGNYFKGFIDLVISCNDKKGKKLYWILDLKTSTSGWRRDKRSDFMTHTQLILYKNYWSKKNNINPKDIRCAFLILKRNGKIGERCDLLPISVGPVTSNKSLKILNNAISGIKKGISLKNRNSCTYCDFYKTEHCK